jgi:hypothetical protein
VIFYLATARHRYTITTYLRSWRPDVAKRLSVVAYESLPRRRHVGEGTYIFSDLERLTASELEMASVLADQLEAAGRRIRIFNHPRRVLLRYELLRTLHERGINSFSAHRLADAHRARLPAFLRHEHTHAGSLTPLLQTERELRDAIDALARAGTDMDRLLVVEYCDTANDDGVFRKYGAFVIGDRVLPRHAFIGTSWVMKVAGSWDDEASLSEDRAYLHTNPHEAAMRKVCAVAGIDYGRVDYGLRDGRPQIWEINTNPHIAFAPQRGDPRAEVQRQFAALLADAFAAIDHPTADGLPVPVSLPRPEQRPAARRGIRGLVHRLRRRLARRAH